MLEGVFKAGDIYVLACKEGLGLIFSLCVQLVKFTLLLQILEQLINRALSYTL